MSATQQTPPSEPDSPPPAPERHCRRCGATLGPDQEWCLACGAAVRTEVARPRGWRLPLVLVAAIVVLAIAAAVLAIAELSRGPEKVAQATPTPAVTPAPTVSPIPSATATPGGPENEGDQPPAAGATATATPGATVSPTATPSPSTTGGTFSAWPAGRTAWTVILESAPSRSQAESVASDLQSKGDTVGILNSDDHSSLKPGYWVVFSGQYDSKAAAQSGLDALASKPADAYVRKVSAT